ncbi:MAG: AAA family ATPase, partial [Patescibacteria group bacterium]
MFLEKLTIQGFKSFANKNVLIFPGMMGKTKRGITAVVGPNGSGKSNIADSVRWSLGEQSMKTLRGKKFEDVIFSGSDKKGRLGMSEVSLYLNNEDKKAPIDYEKVILTRRLFRDGESEYLINNSRVRLADIQIMLAKANFGQKTYSVIGQGVVEGFLNTSLAERKEFFDEATGVKQFQIKRDDSLNKLRISHENLGQIKMLLDEIEPRLKSLTRQVNKLQKRGQLEVELKGLQLKYYAKIWHSLNDKFNQVNKQFIALEQEKRKKEEKLKQLTGELDKISAENKVVEDFNKLQDQVNELQAAKDKIIQQLAKYDARTEVSLEARGKFDLAWLHSKKADLAKEIAQKNEEIKILESNIVSERNHWQELDEEKKQFDNKINKLNNILSGLNSDVDKQKIEDINGKLKNFLSQLDKAEGEKNLNKIKEIISNLRETVKKLLSILGKTSPKEDLDKIHKDIINLTEAKEIIVNKINESNLRILARSERVKLLKIETKKINTDLSEIEQKLKEEDIKDKKGEFANQKKELKDKLNKIEQKLKEVNEKVINFTKEEEDKKDRLFLLQKNWQTLQSEV